MLFNSWTFILFFLTVLAFYALANRTGGYRLQNRVLLVASNVFYAGWDYHLTPEAGRRYALAVLARLESETWAARGAP